MDLTAVICKCGAVTVSDDIFINSMSYPTFLKKHSNLKLESKTYYNCDYCANHWGIDLCDCGSGISPDKCCGKSAQIIGQSKEFIGWH